MNTPDYWVYRPVLSGASSGAANWTRNGKAERRSYLPPLMKR
jgi:hypothetical protein